MLTTRTRLVPNNQTVVDQIDVFAGDGFTRVTGLVPNNFGTQLFFNNQLQPWPFTTGTGVTDFQIASGSLYFNEIPGSPGFYSLRFRPNAVGYWRHVVTYTSGTQTIIHEYDVTQFQQDDDDGLKASFIRHHR